MEKQNRKIDADAPRDILDELVRVLYKKGATDIKAYEVTEDNTLTDYHIIATGRSTTHVRSLADDLDVELEKCGVSHRSVEGRDGGAWILLDFLSVIVHVFEPTSREFYNLERLWKQENAVDIAPILSACDESI